MNMNIISIYMEFHSLSLSFSAAGCLDFPIGIVLDEMETKKCGNGNEQGNRKRPAADSREGTEVKSKAA